MTDGLTTIQVTDEQRDRLESRTTEGEPIRAGLERLLDDSGVLFDEAEIRRIAREEAEGVITDYNRL